MGIKWLSLTIYDLIVKTRHESIRQSMKTKEEFCTFPSSGYIQEGVLYIELWELQKTLEQERTKAQIGFEFYDEAQLNDFLAGKEVSYYPRDETNPLWTVQIKPK